MSLERAARCKGLQPAAAACASGACAIWSAIAALASRQGAASALGKAAASNT